jgi:hypothetical protein
MSRPRERADAAVDFWNGVSLAGRGGRLVRFGLRVHMQQYALNQMLVGRVRKGRRRVSVAARVG